MGERPGGHLGGGGRLCALGVAVCAALALSSATLALPGTRDTNGLAGASERARLLEHPSTPARMLALADDPEDDPAAEAVPVHVASSLSPAELLANDHAGGPVALPAAAPAPRGPPSGAR